MPLNITPAEFQELGENAMNELITTNAKEVGDLLIANPHLVTSTPSLNDTGLHIISRFNSEAKTIIDEMSQKSNEAFLNGSQNKTLGREGRDTALNREIEAYEPLNSERKWTQRSNISDRNTGWSNDL